MLNAGNLFLSGVTLVCPERLNEDEVEKMAKNGMQLRMMYNTHRFVETENPISD